MTCRSLIVAMIAATSFVSHGTASTVQEEKGTGTKPPPLQPSAGDKDGFVSIFNGKDLEGWEGDARFWSVKEGVITGWSTEQNPCTSNTFLVWRKGRLEDFELRLEFKMEGGNSGVQFRSKEAGRFEVEGYQADIEDGPSWTGGLYEEKGRGIMVRRGQEVSVNEAGELKVTQFADGAALQRDSIKSRDWNRCTITARGDDIKIFVNGVLMSKFLDHPKHSTRSGILALQLHSGPPMKVQYRNLCLKDLGGDSSTADKKAPES